VDRHRRLAIDDFKAATTASDCPLADELGVEVSSGRNLVEHRHQARVR
jgi:hypothetical protein